MTRAITAHLNIRHVMAILLHKLTDSLVHILLYRIIGNHNCLYLIRPAMLKLFYLK